MKKLRRARAVVMASLPVDLVRAAAEGLRRGLIAIREARGPVLTFRPAVPSAALALVVADLTPFRTPAPNGPPPLPSASREDHWRSVLLVRMLLELGYDVDVMADHEAVPLPAKPYALILATPLALSRASPHLSSDCLRVLHVNTADTLFQNAAELHRLLDLKDRRGLVLAPARYRRPTSALREASCVIVQGNDFTASTYRHAKKPIYQVPLVSDLRCQPPTSKDFEQSRKRFVWIGDDGLVAKGLDLVLEAFVAMPHCSLTVCGPFQAEPRFAEAYARELSGTPHIQSRGSLELSSPRLAELAASSDALILPSCAEGQALEVVAAMQCGLIPVISRESGVDVDDFGIVLPDCSIDAIREVADYLGSLPSSKRREMAMHAWESARAKHSPTVVAERYRQILREITSRAPAR